MGYFFIFKNQSNPEKQHYTGSKDDYKKERGF